MSPAEKTRRIELSLSRALCSLVEFGLLALVIGLAAKGHELAAGLFGVVLILITWLDGNFHSFMENQTKETTSA